ncbi:MAG: hypothetical protein K0S47_4327 [Herbinix sp.]|jgi:hypothetical protein|nr:hypothetical protein [Herbinix sp.]
MKLKASKSSYVLRIIAGSYLGYLSYSMFTDWESLKEANQEFMIIFPVIFAVAGVALVVLSLVGLFRMRNEVEEIDADESIDHNPDEEDDKE